MPLTWVIEVIAREWIAPAFQHATRLPSAMCGSNWAFECRHATARAHVIASGFIDLARISHSPAHWAVLTDAGRRRWRRL
ncbi:hypothetical protein FA323_16895, partial [Pseudomonas aeruginosa]|nr:hypothetical protein [Pseudomonas aeruginosa]